MNRAISTIMIIVVLSSFLVITPTESQGIIESLTYRLFSDGTASVTVIVTPQPESDVIKIPLEKGYVQESALAFTKEGVPLYVNISGSTAEIYVYNLTTLVILTYEAKVGNVSEGLISVEVNPPTKSVVYLPADTALVSATGDPEITAENDTIVLVYSSGGRFHIDMLLVPPFPTTSTTSPPQNTTTSTQGPPTETHTTPPEFTPTNYIIWGLIVAGMLILVVFLILYIMRGRKGKSVEVEITSGLDDRDVLILKALKGEELSLSDLARKLGLNKSVVWRRVNRMSELGYLRKRMEKGRTMFSLTDKGRELLSGLEEGS